MKRVIFITAFVLGFVLALLVVFSPTLGVSAEPYAGTTLVIIPTFLFTVAPALRLARLGNYLRQGGLDSIARRGSFRARDDHFFLDYSIGRWFQHSSFALGYVGLTALYFLGWFMIGVFLLLLSIPLLAIAFLISRRLARSLLSPYDPKDVALRIELIYPAKSLRRISANPPLVLVTFLYLVAIGYIAPTLFLFVLLVIPYAILVLYLRVIRPRSHLSDKQ